MQKVREGKTSEEASGKHKFSNYEENKARKKRFPREK